ncbi:MAG: AraC family transcriptional regulator [Phycisphaeraceae bacterium]|nr:AraC family transcriptional regulator [Phycisphaeraceae bacterium]
MKLSSTISLELGRCGRVRCEPGWGLRPGFGADLEDLDFWLVWAGRGQMTVGGEEIALYPGVCVWMRPGGDYRASQARDDRLGVTFIHFDLYDGDGQRLIQSEQLPAEHTVFPDVTLAESLARRVVELAASAENRAPAPGASDLFRGLLHEYVRAAADPGTEGGTAQKHQRRVAPLVDQIREAPGESPSVESMARAAGYSPDHFSRVFREVTGQSPTEMVINLRIERARGLLRETAMAVGEIAEALGYCDVYFFSRQFRQRVGVSPTQYRRDR